MFLGDQDRLDFHVQGAHQFIYILVIFLYLAPHGSALYTVYQLPDCLLTFVCYRPFPVDHSVDGAELEA